jgi:hypothetical protein
MLQSIIAIIQCPFTKQCQNNQCFWRQRDVFGRTPWAIAYMHDKENQDKITQEHGEPYFPDLKISTLTNCLGISCPDYQGENCKTKIL